MQIENISRKDILASIQTFLLDRVYVDLNEWLVLTYFVYKANDRLPVGGKEEPAVITATLFQWDHQQITHRRPETSSVPLLQHPMKAPTRKRIKPR